MTDIIGTDLTIDEHLHALLLKTDPKIGVNQLSEVSGANFLDRLAQIDKTIDQLTTHISSLKEAAHRIKFEINAEQPANRVPYEVLERIFTYRHLLVSASARAHIDESDDIFYEGLSWIGVSHISSRWRKVALSVPDLWRAIHLPQDLSMALAFFERSHPLPIDLNERSSSLSRSYETLQDAFYGVLLEKPERIRSLHVRRAFHTHISNLLKKKSPDIQVTSLIIYLGSNSGICGSDIALPNEWIRNLQRLSITGSAWTMSWYPALTHLYVCPEGASSSLKLEGFLFMLRMLSMTLQVLYLYRSGPIFETSSHLVSPKQGDCIRMPCLRLIEITHYRDPDFALYFLHKLILPDSVRITWDTRLTSFRYNSDVFELPPPDTLACIKRVHFVKRGYDENSRAYRYVLDGKTRTMYVPDLGGYVSSSVTGRLSIHLKNVEFLALMNNDLREEILNFDYPLATSVRTVTYEYAADLLAALEVNASSKPGGSNPRLLPQLSTLTIYTGEIDISGQAEQAKLMERMQEKGVSDFQLTNDLTTLRVRPHMATSYVVEFKPGEITPTEFPAFESVDDDTQMLI